MDDKSSDNGSFNRRDVLKSTFATGFTAIGMSSSNVAANAGVDDVHMYGRSDPVTEKGDRTVTVKASGDATYRFEVTGVLSATGAPSGTVDRGTATGEVSDGTHEFSFSGEFTTFETKGDLRVTVDGDAFDVSAFPHNTLKITPQDKTSFDVSASGGLNVVEKSLKQPNQRRATGTMHEPVIIEYEGELTYLELDGAASLQKNGNSVSSPSDALPSTNPHAASITSTHGSDEYEVTITDSAEIEHSAATDDVEGSTVVGRAIKQPTRIRYAGDIRRIAHESGAEMVINEEARKSSVLRLRTRFSSSRLEQPKVSPTKAKFTKTHR